MAGLDAGSLSAEEADALLFASLGLQNRAETSTDSLAAQLTASSKFLKKEYIYGAEAMRKKELTSQLDKHGLFGKDSSTAAEDVSVVSTGAKKSGDNLFGDDEASTRATKSTVQAKTGVSTKVKQIVASIRAAYRHSIQNITFDEFIERLVKVPLNKPINDAIKCVSLFLTVAVVIESVS